MPAILTELFVLLKSRLSRRIGCWVFLSVIIIETISIVIKSKGNLLLRKKPPIRPSNSNERKSSVLKVIILETHLGRG